MRLLKRHRQSNNRCSSTSICGTINFILFPFFVCSLKKEEKNTPNNEYLHLLIVNDVPTFIGLPTIYLGMCLLLLFPFDMRGYSSWCVYVLFCICFNYDIIQFSVEEWFLCFASMNWSICNAELLLTTIFLNALNHYHNHFLFICSI